MANSELRKLLKVNGIPYWKIADVLGVHENTVQRKLRHQLTEEDEKAFRNAVDVIMAKNNRLSVESTQTASRH